MPDDITHNPLVGKQPGADDAAAHNAEIAAKLADQDASGKSTAATQQSIDDTSSALDALAAQVTKQGDDAPAPPEVTPAKTDATPAKTDDAAAPVVEKPTVTPKPDATPAPQDDATKKKAEDIFKDTPGLPPGASPKSSEAFATIKIKAAQEITARETEIEKLKKQVADYEASKGKPSPEQEAILKELEDLRTWRAKLDVDFDPKFKEHDKGIESARDFVYAQLQKYGEVVTPEVVAEIKKFGGPDNTNLSKVFEAIKDPVLQRVVEAKLADIEMMKYQKQQAIQSAKSNITEWTKKRETEWQQAAVAHTKNTQTHLDPMLGALEWFKEKQVDDKADDNAKKSATEHNKFVGELRGQIQEVMRDDSPQMRAILIAGMAQLFNLQRAHAGVKADLESTKKALEEVTGKYERVKNASVSRLRASNAPDASVPPVTKTADVNTSTGDALDAIAKQVMEARAAANK